MNKSKYKKSGYFDFEALEKSKSDLDKNIKVKIIEQSKDDLEDKIENFDIPTDKYKKTLMKIKKIKYEIKD